MGGEDLLIPWWSWVLMGLLVFYWPWWGDDGYDLPALPPPKDRRPR